jgi:C4-dicarboxylate-specific signal transduction histidine kinase
VPFFLGDRIHLRQVILSPIRNAIEAMIGQPARKLLVASAKDGSNGVLAIARDPSIGLAGRRRTDSWRPSTPPKAQGIKTGLAVGRTIVGAHGGWLWATPNVSQGIFQFLSAG